MTFSVVWFKRDLRVHDHAPLRAAAERGPVMCLYILEPSLWRQPDYAVQHYQFLRESLRDLALHLRELGAQLQLAVGEVTEVFERLRCTAPELGDVSHIFSHEETGNAHTFARDLALGRWCKQSGVVWQEFAQHGVVRGLRSRDHWDKAWFAHMSSKLLAAPAPASLQGICLPWVKEVWPEPQTLGMSGFDTPRRQQGGRAMAVEVFDEFLDKRSHWYRGGISSPLSAPTACSRLSPYLALGCLSMREVVQTTENSMHELMTSDDAQHQRQAKSLGSFLSRLHWHCHFIQKLESEPELELHNLHRGYDGLREEEWNQAHFEALVEGRTGWPMVDACVAMLRETGWINFRMRAMLVSVASYALWLHWRPVGLWLARQFLDYEPGIHWSQMQMQAGTTGINATRVYNPIKQAQDHDPHGQFVRRWLPTMRRVPDMFLLQPWLMPAELQQQCGLQVGKDIAIPLVDFETATRLAKARVHALRSDKEVRAAKAAIVDKHGSRLRRQHSSQGDKSSKRKTKSQQSTSLQHSLDF
ncbi:deoxyribodipyrimidine photo-lyase [Undibacterium sp. LX40W]|uniref:Deoxyribodipyrimidine photo-lyase n=1 Tax=Undibacterium nitidum TaxID=2762298 RepID=A0A923HMN0_9BURK|nr:MULTISPECIES: FAD-binding domain-containing protein [Undibacterium]MBC3881173.1 deoxyribodipyrimidine photo-lyase [Undibacterium nitidum]MBC3890094.1 deoxyribodipyrimidine photo-lyase [Undibacterium sp. LX40W]